MLALAPYLLSLVAALFFLLIGLEELPVRFNVERVARAVRRRARRTGDWESTVADMMRSTRRSAWILLGFALASALLLAYLAWIDKPAPTTDVLVFSVTLVWGLSFLAFTFHFWAPRLMRSVEETIRSGTGSNPPPPLVRESP